MIYRMSRKMFMELAKDCGGEKRVIEYVNQTFGLIGKVAEIQFI